MMLKVTKYTNKYECIKWSINNSRQINYVCLILIYFLLHNKLLDLDEVWFESDYAISIIYSLRIKNSFLEVHSCVKIKYK